MIDLSWTTQRFDSPPTAQRRVLVVVDRNSADARLMQKLAPRADLPPAAVIWLWVVTPGAVVSWGALLAESGDRTHLLLSALSKRMDEARHFLTPLQRACHIADVPCQTHILHGAVVESVVRLARIELAEQVLLATADGAIYEQSSQDLATTLTQRLNMPIGILE